MKQHTEFDNTSVVQALDQIEEYIKHEGAIMLVGLTIDHNLVVWGWYPETEAGVKGLRLFSVKMIVEGLVYSADPRAKKLLDRLKEQALPADFFE